jgi:hypothetical protein
LWPLLFAPLVLVLLGVAVEPPAPLSLPPH